MPSSKNATQIPFIWAQISNNIGRRSKHRNMKNHNTGFFNLHSKYYICAPVMQIRRGVGWDKVMPPPNFKTTFKHLLQAFPKLPKSFLLSAATISLNFLILPSTSAISV